MSVLVKGMDIPNNCIMCPFCALNRYGERYCMLTDRTTDPAYYTYERYEECPIKEVEDDTDT